MLWRTLPDAKWRDETCSLVGLALTMSKFLRCLADRDELGCQLAFEHVSERDGGGGAAMPGSHTISYVILVLGSGNPDLMSRAFVNPESKHAHLFFGAMTQDSYKLLAC